MDDEARKQLLLTRIAHQRLEWVHDVHVFRTAAEPRKIASHALRSLLPDGVDRVLFGSSGPGGSGGLSAGLGPKLLHAVLVARRYPILLSIAGGLLARRAIRRLLFLGVVGAAITTGVVVLKSRR